MNRRDLIKIGASVAASPGLARQTTAFSPKFFADGRVDERSRFVEGLGSLDAAVLNKHTVPFIKCAKPLQIAILTDLDQAKALTSRTYYATSTGYRELNKDGRAPAQAGCKHSEHA